MFWLTALDCRFHKRRSTQRGEYRICCRAGIRLTADWSELETFDHRIGYCCGTVAAAPLLRAPASRRCQSISISCPRGRALSSKPATRRCCGRSMWQTDWRTRRYTRLSDHSLTITSQTVFFSTWVLIARVGAAYQPQCDICSPKFWASCLEHVELGLLCYD